MFEQSIEKDGFCTVHPKLPARMGLTLGGAQFRTLADVPLLDVAKIDAHIDFWRRKSAAAPDEVCRALAEGHVSALLLVRVDHGLPLQPEGGE